MCCAAVRRCVVQGILLGGVGPPGVVVFYGRVRSRWCDVHRPAPRWEQASLQPSCHLLPCAWPARDLCRACVAVRRRCKSCGGVRLRALGVSHASHKGAAEGTEDVVHKGRVCRPGLRLSTDGGLPSFAQRQRPDLVDRGVRRHSRGHRLGRGPRVYSWPLCRPLVDPLRGRGGSGGMTGRGVALPPFPVVRGSRGSGKCGPRPGNPGGGSWGFIRVGHHGLLRLASTPWVPVARARQVDAFPAGGPGQRALLECVARPRVVGLYKGVFLGEVGSPGVVVVRGRLRSRWRNVHRPVLRREEAIPRPPCRLSPCAWPARDSCCACAAACRRCRSRGRLWLRALGGYPGVAQGRYGEP